MNVTIYADTLIFINTFITYFLLLCSNRILQNVIHRGRILAASVLGGFYAMVILSKWPTWILLFSKIIVCFLLQYIASGTRSIQQWVKNTLVFLAVNLIFAGGMLAFSLLVHPEGFLASWGCIYFDATIPFVLSLTVCIYGLIRLILLLLPSKTTSNHYGTYTIQTSIGTISGHGLFDTGNSLSDSFTGKPVIIVSPGITDAIVPAAVQAYLSGKPLAECNLPTEWERKIRLFPFSGIKGDGLLPAFKAETVTLQHMNASLILHNVYIAVSPYAINSGNYTALFPCAIYDQIKEGEDKNEAKKRFFKRAVAENKTVVH